MALRIIALYEGSKRIPPVAARLIAQLPGSHSVVSTSSDQFQGHCNLSLTSGQGTSAAMGWISMFLFDSTIFTLTVIKTIQMREILRHGVLKVLFRDGAVYYGILVIAGAINVSTLMAPEIHDNYRGIGATLTNALSTTLASRMFLNLRDPDLRSVPLRIGRWTISQDTVSPQSLSTDRAEAARTLSFRQTATTGGCETDSEPESDA
ncbi:hypothetical protein C8Q77DRAFT_1154723 [Trametes polyzona]|nr:hypothetical protein C8Q77DRAFT_1154723 [Trametes polyzona]